MGWIPYHVWLSSREDTCGSTITHSMVSYGSCGRATTLGIIGPYIKRNHSVTREFEDMAVLMEPSLQISNEKPSRTTMVSEWEKERLATNLRIVQSLIRTLRSFNWLAADHPLPADVVVARKAQTEGGIRPISVAVKTAEKLWRKGAGKLKNARLLQFGDSRDCRISESIAYLVKAHLECWPWAASPLIMSANEAYAQGLSQL